MPEDSPLRRRLVEVIADLGEGKEPRWRYGSGLRIGGQQVLTAAHVVVEAVRLEVRDPDKNSMRAESQAAFTGVPDARRLDLALIYLPDADPLPHVQVARVNRDLGATDVIEGCAAVGYPEFMQVQRDPRGISIRETAQVTGHIKPLSGLVEGLPSLEVTSAPRDLPPASSLLAETPWSGMSGAAVWARRAPGAGEQVLLGIVAEHAARRGPSDVTVLPIDRLLDQATAPANAAEWWSQLGVDDPASLPRLPAAKATLVEWLFDVPARPPHFVERPEAILELKPLLLPGRRVGVHGMGGTGKSVVAASVARSDDTRRTFPDGVVWVTVGRNPDALTTQLRQKRIAEVLNAGGGDLSNVPQGAARLTTLFQSRRCLLVLDDVWRSEDVAAFGDPGPSSCVLITTRNRELLVDLGAADFELGVLTDEQARRLLAEWARQPSDALPASAEDVIAECGNLPAALAMVGAMVRGKPDRWDNVLHKLRNRDLEQIGRDFPQYPYPNLFRVIQISFEDLSPPLRERYLDFAVFERNTLLPMAVLDAFWEPLGLETYDVQDVVDALVDRSLVQRSADGRLRLHDLLVDFAAKTVGTPVTLHGRLVDAYRARAKPDWLGGPNDGYFFENLTFHLVQAGRADEVQELLAREDASGKNAWHARQSAIDPSGALYLRDLVRARAAAEALNAAAAQAEQACPSMGLEIQYALATASIHSRSSSMPAVVLGALVENGVWTAEHALASALQNPDPIHRARALAAVAGALPAPERVGMYRRALGVIREAVGPVDTGMPLGALEELIPALPEALLEDALGVARGLGGDADPTDALIAIARRLPGTLKEDVLSEAMAAARALRDELIDPHYGQAVALAKVGANLSEPARGRAIEEAVAIACDLDAGDSSRARALGEVAMHAPQPTKDSVMREALAAAKAIPLEGDSNDDGRVRWVSERARALTQIAPKLPRALLEEAIAAADALRDQERDKALGPLIVRLAAEGQPEKAIALASGIAREGERAGALVEVAGVLSDVGHLEAVLAAARGLGKRLPQFVSAAVAPGFARAGSFAKAIGVAEAVEGRNRVAAFANSALLLPEPLRSQAIKEALQTAASDECQKDLARTTFPLETSLFKLALGLAKDSDYEGAVAAVRRFPARGSHGGAGPRAEALGTLALRLPAPLRTRILIEALGALTVGDMRERTKTLAAWSAGTAAKEIPPCALDAFAAVLAAASLLPDDEPRRDALVNLAPELPESLLDAALASAQTLGRPEARATALAKLAVRLREPARTTVMNEAFASLKEIKFIGAIAESLREVLPLLTADLQREALGAALHQVGRSRSVMLPAVCALLPLSLQREALPLIVQLPAGDGRLEALVALAAALPEDVQHEVVAGLRAQKDAEDVGRNLATMAPYLTEPVLSEAMSLAQTLEEPLEQARAWAALAPRLARSGRVEEAAQLLEQINWELNDADPLDYSTNLWAKALRDTGPWLPASDPPTADPETLEAAQKIKRGWVRAQVLAALAPWADPSARDAALKAELDALSGSDPDRERAEVLMALAPCLPEWLLPQAMVGACTIADSIYENWSPRAQALAALAVRLARCPRSQIYGVWRDAMHALASHSRKDLLRDLAALTPVLVALAGVESAVDGICRLDRVARWWP
jgi:hypothetical protein